MRFASTTDRYVLGSHLNDQGNWFSGKIEILKGQWQLIIYVGEGSSSPSEYTGGTRAGKTKIYIGNQKYSPVLASTIDKVPSGDCVHRWVFRANPQGVISEFAVWNRALTLTQIKGYWEQSRYGDMQKNEFYHVLNWGSKLNNYYYTDGVVGGIGGGQGNEYVPYRIATGSTIL